MCLCHRNRRWISTPQKMRDGCLDSAVVFRTRNFSLREGTPPNFFVLFILALTDSAQRQINTGWPTDPSEVAPATHCWSICLGIKSEICVCQRPSTQKGPSPAGVLSSSSPSCGLLLSRNAGDALAWQRDVGHSESLPVRRVDLKHHPQANRKENRHMDWPYSSSLLFLFPLCENQFMAAV